MPKISIIIATYNNGDTLVRCLDSICCQTFSDFEIIVINDGSKDDTASILIDYATKDNRVKFFNQTQNVGQGKSRNLGLDNATGEYVGFVDSDDTAQEDMFEEMYKAITKSKASIAQCNINIVNLDGTIKTANFLPFEDEVVDIKPDIGKYFENYLQYSKQSYEICNKLIKRDFLVKNKVYFLDNSKIYAEDLLFNLDVALYAERIVFLNKSLYNYYNNPNGHSKFIDINKLEKFCNLFEEFEKHAKQLKQYDLIKYGIAKNAILIIMFMATQTLYIEGGKKKVKEILKRSDMKKYLKYSLKSSQKFKNKLLNWSLLYLPSTLKFRLMKWHYSWEH